MTDPERPADPVFVPDAGSAVVWSDDPVDTALSLAEQLDAELLEGAERFPEVVAACHAAVSERARAREVLDLLPPTDDRGPQHVVTDLESLRALAASIRRAEALVAATTDAASTQARAALGLDVLAAGIAAAADEVFDARAEDEQRRSELARREAEWRAETQSPPATRPSRGPAGAHLADRPRRSPGADRDGLLSRARGLLTGGSDGGTDMSGEALVSETLAHVSALTERAYEELPEALATLRADLGPGNDRLRRAEETWTALVGEGVEPGNADLAVSQDPAVDVDEHAPSVRAASADLRRLRARWKVAWWALERPVPDVSEPEPALAELEREGLGDITVTAWSTEVAAATAARHRFDAAAAGRTEAQLREAAERPVRAVVLLDETGSVDESDFGRSTADLPDDVRVLLVAPAITARRDEA